MHSASFDALSADVRRVLARQDQSDAAQSDDDRAITSKRLSSAALRREFKRFIPPTGKSLRPSGT